MTIAETIVSDLKERNCAIVYKPDRGRIVLNPNGRHQYVIAWDPFNNVIIEFEDRGQEKSVPITTDWGFTSDERSMIIEEINRLNEREKQKQAKQNETAAKKALKSIFPDAT